jgi:predicted component of type VI protein secretion system
MEFITKLWLTIMVSNEIEKTNQNINNYNLWMKSCNNHEEIMAYVDQIDNLYKYRTTLKNLLKQIEEGTLDV